MDINLRNKILHGVVLSTTVHNGQLLITTRVLNILDSEKPDVTYVYNEHDTKDAETIVLIHPLIDIAAGDIISSQLLYKKRIDIPTIKEAYTCQIKLSPPNIRYKIDGKTKYKEDVVSQPTDIYNPAQNKLVPIPLKYSLSPNEDIEEYLRIGYIKFSVPVTAINVREENGLDVSEILRSEGNIKELDHRVSIVIDISFTIPNITDYNEIVLPLINQFRRTPFLPIDNIYLNDIWGIDAVALRQISISTIENMPGAYTVQMVLEPFAWHAYLYSNQDFSESFCWPIFKMWCDSRGNTQNIGSLTGELIISVAEKNTEAPQIVPENTPEKELFEDYEVIQKSLSSGKTYVRLFSPEVLSQLKPPTNWAETFASRPLGEFPVLESNLDSSIVPELAKYEQILNNIIAKAKYAVESGDTTLFNDYTKDEDLRYLDNIWISMKIIPPLPPIYSTINSEKISPPKIKWVDTDISKSAVITDITAQYSAKIVGTQPKSYILPVHQCLGAGDMYFSITGVINDEGGVSEIKTLFETLRELTQETIYDGWIKREAFTRIRNELINSFGVTSVIPISLTISMVQGHPHIYTFQMELIEFKETQRKNEEIVAMEKYIFEYLAEAYKQDTEIDIDKISGLPENSPIFQYITEASDRKIARAWLQKYMLKTRELYPDINPPSKKELATWIKEIKRVYANYKLGKVESSDKLIVSAIELAEDADKILQLQPGEDVIGFEDPDFYCIPSVSGKQEREEFLSLALDPKIGSVKLKDRFGALKFLDPGKTLEESSIHDTPELTEGVEKETKAIKELTNTKYQAILSTVQPSGVSTDATSFHLPTVFGQDSITVSSAEDATPNIASKITEATKHAPGFRDHVVYAIDLLKGKGKTKKNFIPAGVNIDPDFIIALVALESSFNPACTVKSSSAYGLLQLLNEEVTPESSKQLLDFIRAEFNAPYIHKQTTNIDIQLVLGIGNLIKYYSTFNNNEFFVALAHKEGQARVKKAIAGKETIPMNAMVYAKGAIAIKEAVKNSLDKLEKQIKHKSLAERITLSSDNDWSATLSGNVTDDSTHEILAEAERKETNIKIRDMFYDFEHREDINRLIQAFPTYFVCIMDEGRWIGYERLWDHFYGGFGINSIEVVQSRMTPVDVATIVFSNTYGRLTSQLQLNKQINENDTRRIWTMEAILGGIKQTFSGRALPDLKERWSRYASGLLLRPGARLHIRLGYSADASKLPVKFNGVISDVPLSNNTVQVVALGDGYELYKPLHPNTHMVSKVEDNGVVVTNTGIFNTPKEPSQVIRELWQPASKYPSIITRGWFLSDNVNGITHFGTIDFSKALKYSIGEVGVNIYTSRESRDPENEYNSIRNWFNGVTQIWEGPTGYTLFGVHLAGATPWKIIETCRKAVPDYVAAVRPFEFRSTLFYGKETYPFYYEYKDGKENPMGSILRKEVIQKNKELEEAICKPLLKIFGLEVYAPILAPTHTNIKSDDLLWRYDEKTEESKAYSELMNAKAFSQIHFISSNYNLIGGTIGASEEAVYTNCQARYTYGLIGSGTESGDLVKADSDIFPEFQKTKIVSSGLLSGPLHGAEGLQNLLYKGLQVVSLGQAHPRAVKTAANIYAATELRDDIANMYYGFHILRGDPYINAFDYCYVTDTQTQLHGGYQVKEVVNTFSVETGYLTSVSPDCLVSLSSTKKLSFLIAATNILRIYTSYVANRLLAFVAILGLLRGPKALKLAAVLGYESATKALATYYNLEKIHTATKVRTIRDVEKEIKDAEKKLEEINKNEALAKKFANSEEIQKALKSDDERIAQKAAKQIEDSFNALEEDKKHLLETIEILKKEKEGIKNTLNEVFKSVKIGDKKRVTQLAIEFGEKLSKSRGLKTLRIFGELEAAGTTSELKTLVLGRLARGAKLLGALSKLATIIVCATVGDLIGRWLASRQCLIMVPLSLKGAEFTAGINGHAGLVVGDTVGTIDHILGIIFNSEYASKQLGITGAILPFVIDFFLPGAADTFNPAPYPEVFDDQLFSQYMANIRQSENVITNNYPQTKFPTINPSGLVRPVNGTVTSRFGNRTHPILKKTKFHTGIDIAASVGTPIYAVGSGKVIYAGFLGSAGKKISIKHENGMITNYLHCNDIQVSIGQMVHSGQQIGTVGSTGVYKDGTPSSTGPHLHFEVIVNGNKVNPEDYFPEFKE